MIEANYKLRSGEREIWRGRQWIVTTRGMGCLTRNYWLSKSALGETARHWRHPSETFTVINHMATKPWLDADDFFTGFCIAVVDLKIKITPAVVQAGLERVRADISEDEAFRRKAAVWREMHGLDPNQPSVLSMRQIEEIDALPDPAAVDDTIIMRDDE